MYKLLHMCQGDSKLPGLDKAHASSGAGEGRESNDAAVMGARTAGAGLSPHAQEATTSAGSRKACAQGRHLAIVLLSLPANKYTYACCSFFRRDDRLDVAPCCCCELTRKPFMSIL